MEVIAAVFAWLASEIIGGILWGVLLLAALLAFSFVASFPLHVRDMLKKRKQTQQK